MGEFVRGQVVVLPFPFSDQETKKYRPALVLADVGGPYQDLIFCMISAKPSEFAIQITKSDFETGELRQQTSYVKPDRLFTAEPRLITKAVGTLKSSKMKEIMDQVRRIFGLEDQQSDEQSEESS